MTPQIASGARPRPLVHRLLAAAPWILLITAVADWLGLKSGVMEHPPWALAALVAVTMLAMLARLAAVLLTVARRRRPRGAGTGEALLLVGALMALSGGLANWLLALQGYAILHEGEMVPLADGSHLQAFEEGPLARIEEMNLVLGLERVELVEAGGGLFYPRSHLFLQADGGKPLRLDIDRRIAGTAGPLRFHQGAFGFAPRIVLLRDTEPVFDRVVPFTTERRGPEGISFDGNFTIAAEALDVRGRIDLRSLDDGLRGHATLHLEVYREGTLLGRGSLSPGHFADIEQGWRVGFAGLEKWSEIDVSRRSYGEVVRAGAALALVGATFWLLARWRQW